MHAIRVHARARRSDGAFAGSALAADVQLYGLVDLGLNWTQVDKGTTTTDSFGMGSGQNSGSRFGLKGTEDLGNGYKVGFNLENSFKADDGALDKGSRPLLSKLKCGMETVVLRGRGLLWAQFGTV